MTEHQSPEMAEAERAIEWVINDIERASIKGEAKTAGFILISCAIDFLATLYAGKDSSREVYARFISRFFDKNLYDGGDLRQYLRNGLVHNYTIHDSKYTLKDGRPDLHGQEHERKIILNLENFFEDLVKAKQKYLDELKANPDLQEKLKRQVSKVGVLGLVPLPPKPAWDKQPSSGSSAVGISKRFPGVALAGLYSLVRDRWHLSRIPLTWFPPMIWVTSQADAPTRRSGPHHQDHGTATTTLKGAN